MPRAKGNGGSTQQGWGQSMVPKDYPISKDIEDRRGQGTLSKAWDTYVGWGKDLIKDVRSSWEPVTKREK